MDYYKSLNITQEQLKKISPDLYKAIEELGSIKDLIDTGLAPSNTIRVYNTLLREIEAYLYSDQFYLDAKAKGIIVRTLDGNEVDIQIEKIEEAEFDPFEELEKITQDKPILMPELPKPKVEVDITKDEDFLSELEATMNDDKGIEEELEPQEDIEKEKPTPKENIETIDVAIASDKFTIGSVLACENKNLTTSFYNNILRLLIFGGCDNILYRYKSEEYDRYLFKLPQSLSVLVIELGRYIFMEDTSNQKNILEKYGETKGKLYLLSTSELEHNGVLAQLENGNTTNAKYEKEINSFDDEMFDIDNYKIVSNKFAKSVFDKDFYRSDKKVVSQWKNLLDTDSSNITEEKVNEYLRATNFIYGLDYLSYLYPEAKRLYSDKGVITKISGINYYSPYINSQYSNRKQPYFYEVSSNIKNNGIDTSNFDRSNYTYKILKSDNVLRPLYVANTNFNSFSFNQGDVPNLDTHLVFGDYEGRSINVSLLAYNYFIKYYGVNIVAKSSEDNDFIYFEKDGNVVGLVHPDGISSSNAYFSNEVSLNYNIEELKQQLRTIDTETFDNLRDIYELMPKVKNVDNKGKVETIKEEPKTDEVNPFALTDEERKIIEDEIEVLEAGLEFFDPKTEAKELEEWQSIIDGLKMSLNF